MKPGLGFITVASGQWYSLVSMSPSFVLSKGSLRHSDRMSLIHSREFVLIRVCEKSVLGCSTQRKRFLIQVVNSVGHLELSP